MQKAPNFNNSFKIRDTEYKFRKWKVKDKNKFLKILESESGDITQAQNILVYECLQNQNVVFSSDEFRYAITQIRIASLGSTTNFQYTCESCEEDQDVKLVISEVIKPQGTKYTDIIVGSVELIMGDIPNKDFYTKKISECETQQEEMLVDFLYRIKSINGSDAFTFDELVDYFDDLDVDVADEILRKWAEQKFTIDDVHTLICPQCKNAEQFMFDEIPDFFPQDWFI